MSVRREIEHGVTGLADGIRDEAGYDSRHGSVDRIHAPEGDWQKVP